MASLPFECDFSNGALCGFKQNPHDDMDVVVNDGGAVDVIINGKVFHYDQ